MSFRGMNRTWETGRWWATYRNNCGEIGIWVGGSDSNIPGSLEI